MKKIITIIFLLTIIPFYLFADNVSKGDCNTSLDDYDGQATITFLGDSLGDFVDDPTWGWVGWDAYLYFHRSDIPWRVQNLAVAGWKTNNVFDYLKECTGIKKRDNFKTANHVAFEIGGNDFITWYPILTYMPWKFSSYTDPLTNEWVVGSTEYILHNTKAIIRFLRHPMIDKDVLVMGNFPALSHSPSLGDMGDYFDMDKKRLDDFYLKFQEVKGSLRMSREDNANLLNEFLQAFNALEEIQELLVKQFNLRRDFINHTLEEIANWSFHTDIDLSRSKPTPSELKQDYLKWLAMVKANPTTILSLGLFFTQPGLEQTAIDEREYTRSRDKTYNDPKGNMPSETVPTDPSRKGGDYVFFLPLYPLLVRQTDCLNWGQCWVGEPVFFRDFLPGHVNHLGYTVWASQIAKKATDLNWQNQQLRNDGKVHHFNFEDQPDIEVEIEPYQAPPPPSNIDWLILLCFIFGQCHF
ncbi:MAG: SGNH/GDSL hydrolase family protein [Leptospiraceae bacterium]|nr:SGNH/GDSL hydrolase family protein [Leptospiraceae bacterium]